MNYFQKILFFFDILYVIGQDTGIRLLYFDPATKLYPGSNGVVILELNNGTKATICMNFNSLNDARVICKMMNYTVSSAGLPSMPSVAFISSIKTKLGKTYFQNLLCTGNEDSLEKCPGYKYTNPVDFKCQNNNQDLSVSCLYKYNYSNTLLSDLAPQLECPKPMLQVDQFGFLQFNNSGNLIYFCGAKNKFSTNEAQLFCKLLCYENATNARIVQGINMTTAQNVPIGGFNNMSCPANAFSLADCSNIFPFQSDECTPSDNIGIACTVSSLIIDPLPIVLCENNTLKLLWNRTVHTTIQPADVTIEYSNDTCSNVIKSNLSDVLILSVSLNDCNGDVTGDFKSVIYSFGARRTFPKVNNIQVKDDQKFSPTCYINRNYTISQGPFSIKASSITGGTGSTDVPVQLDMFTDATFQTSLTDLKKVAVGTTVFVKIMLLNPPANLILVLVECYVTDDNTKVYLIQNRCPVKTDVQINPISDIISSFNFVSFIIPGAVKLNLICQTSKCGKNEIGCITKC